MRERFLLLGCFMVVMSTIAQQLPQHGQDPCATMEQDSISRARYPQRGTLDELETAIQKRVEAIRQQQKSGKIDAVEISIPIIVHVVHNGEAVGTGTNISQAQVQSQIEVLNEDFRKMLGTPGYNTNPVGADIEINFCLSPVDENGSTMAEPGIHRYDGNRADWSRDQIENQLKPTTIWNTNLFYNIWTVKFAASDANLIGYAQFPDQSGLVGIPASGPASTDGVVIRYQSFGSIDKGNFPVMVAPYNKGRTLSHETGHWLGLRHIWGDGVCADDFVADTPTQNGPSSGCPNSLACNSATPAMVQNYMDYSNDACMNIFTEGQKLRMRAVMDISPRRQSLIAANLCSPAVADVPTANFTVDQQLVLLGGQASFTDLSTNFPTQWNWTFEGGDPNTSTARNPKVKYTVPGIYKVTLVATNSLGASAPLEMADYITVSEEGLCNTASNFEAGYTPSIIPLSDFGSYTGYLTGHNSLQSKAVSEFFENALGYEYLSGVNIRFGYVNAASEESTLTVVVWNARGPQNAPGSVIERKVVLLKQIADDVANDRVTSVVFDRETPVFNMPYQVGIELDYSQGDEVVIQSSANGEALDATSWIKNSAGTWSPYATLLGANIAMKIEPFVGMNPSVQVSASKLLINPGEEVVLNGRGASIFIWDSSDGSVNNFSGPQLIVRPTQTTTYETTGSGLTLCNTLAATTIYTRDNVTAVEDKSVEKEVQLFPNPGTSQLQVTMENDFQGEVVIQLLSSYGNEVQRHLVQKTEGNLIKSLNTSPLAPGLYLVTVRFGKYAVIKKWIRY
ncbi:MAG TPA: M43 family zinc metalloprotease [Cyclobacteriaceae bacterium]|nr:M43 family zinc metalloprotease [Cyclobacteriaceae bacterium]